MLLKEILIFLGKYKEKVVSAAIFVFWQDMCFYHHSGSLTEFNKIPVSYLLQWEAIKNAKDTAAQFAKESGSSLGSVSRGNQGVFDISDKDPGSPEYKKIRVVSTLRFLLK